MKRVAVEGAGLSPWEAEVLIDAIDEVYFSDPDLKGLSVGQMKYSCVCAAEGAGKPLRECSMATVLLTILDAEDRRDLPSDGKQASVHRRWRKITRLTEEAREQGGLLTQEDLAMLLDSDVRTIRRDIRQLREDGIVAATRGQQKDIGPGVSHRGLAIRHWLEGKEPACVPTLSTALSRCFWWMASQCWRSCWSRSRKRTRSSMGSRPFATPPSVQP